MRNIEAEDILSEVPFFSSLNHRDLKRLANLCLPKHFDKGAEILKEGSVGLGLFLISAGRVEVFKTDQGRRQRLAVLGDGDVLGEMALIDDKPRSASAVALEPTSALLLSRDGFRTVVKKSPAVAWALVPELAGRLRETEDRLLAAEVRGADRTDENGDNATEPAPDSRSPAAGRQDGNAAETEEDWKKFQEKILCVPYAVLMSWMAGLGGSFGVFQIFFQELAEKAEDEKGLFPKLTRLPWKTLSASLSSMNEARKIPEETLDAFLRHLNGAASTDGHPESE